MKCRTCGTEVQVHEAKTRFGKTHCGACAEAMDDKRARLRKERNVPYEAPSLWPCRNK